MIDRTTLAGVVGLAALCVPLGSCMLGPTNGDRIATINTPVVFSGFDVLAGATITVEALDPIGMDWEAIGSTVASTVPFNDYYYFSTSLAIPARFWKSNFDFARYEASVRTVSSGGHTLFSYEPGDFDVQDPVGSASPESPVVTLLADMDVVTMDLYWPLPGFDTRDWVINNYVDLDRSSGMRDYTGATGSSAKVYDNHSGIDIDVANFRAMDEDFPVIASAAGVVVTMAENQPDRNTATCSCNWNFVTLRHSNGFETTYGHLKRNSVSVAVGDFVQAGDSLGVVGSSGNSTQPHLHFEVHDGHGRLIDPFARGMWVATPVYDTPIGIMDISLHAGLPSIAQVKDPGTDIQTIAAGGSLGIGVSLAGGDQDDSITLRLRDPNGNQHATIPWDLTGVNRHAFLRFFMPVGTMAGTWTLEGETNAVPSWLSTFTVN